jgi:hypothetical protein
MILWLDSKPRYTPCAEYVKIVFRCGLRVLRTFALDRMHEWTIPACRILSILPEFMVCESIDLYVVWDFKCPGTFIRFKSLQTMPEILLSTLLFALQNSDIILEFASVDESPFSSAVIGSKSIETREATAEIDCEWSSANLLLLRPQNTLESMV